MTLAGSRSLVESSYYFGNIRGSRPSSSIFSRFGNGATGRATRLRFGW